MNGSENGVHGHHAISSIDPLSVEVDLSRDENDAGSSAACIGSRWLQRTHNFAIQFIGLLDRQFFLIFVFVAILLAAVTSSVGKKGGVLSPSISTGYVATMLIFLISGVNLNTKDFIVAVKNYKLNVFVLVFNMCIITLVMYAVAAILRPSSFSNELLTGLVILGALPTSVSMCVILTTAASGDAAGALFNATALNIIGIFLTPLWLLGLLSANSTISIELVILKLAIKVVIPLFCGQFIRYVPHEGFSKLLKVLGSSLL